MPLRLFFQVPVFYFFTPRAGRNSTNDWTFLNLVKGSYGPKYMEQAEFFYACKLHAFQHTERRAQ